ncbi:D-tagatose-bisphosphate aldolase, class II, non-catalytic subunit [Thalassospira marina]|uniref:D-tagatose-bisphosphate aldolase, class II, non-catalytic subunit n=1 Tax=Thalassospira marina TaxID=2048283 RepID=A0A2N3KWQ4_9PROT|nr:D-tagatose-bisphosphate aldolase, class II, non-catalytic subunit [Thalassospira marina]PKR55011.1 D-tagatose-bisphosphate aldolase, class II, non-catalytic subunit [Thalassospira marina]
MTYNPFLEMLRSRADGEITGIPSICSSHPLVIEAALIEGKANQTPVLIEATCNQVNQEGGYTGMTPSDFRQYVEQIAHKTGFDPAQLLLGGDHLGPNPWKDQTAEEAMKKAEILIAQYAQAGFVKIHLDASMSCQDDPVPLPDAIIAERSARLARIAEQSCRGEKPVYIIGTEVPIPGGAMEALDHLEVTSPQDAIATYEAHREAFAKLGLQNAFSRVIGLVVQPGVEFGNENVVYYDPKAATDLSAALSQLPGIAFEAHSTDYQPETALSDLVRDGFAILKVGPGVTFAMREALYGLDKIATFLDHSPEKDSLEEQLEQLMQAEPKYWEKYYHGNDEARRLQRHFSYSDRIRYYWPSEIARKAVDGLLARLEKYTLPETLISQFLPRLYPHYAAQKSKPSAQNLIIEMIRLVIRDYEKACRRI